MTDFSGEVADRIRQIGAHRELTSAAAAFMRASISPKYSYNFTWLGRPIIQYPQDIVAMQELIWRVRPDLIVETGIAHGGSIIFSASMLALLDMCDAIASGGSFDPAKSARKVLAVDIDIREHNRAAIESHLMMTRIEILHGSSVAPEVVKQVHDIAKDYRRVMVCLDSNHTHDHVLAELQAYAELTSVDSYCVVFDTVIEDLPKSMFPDRPWGPGNNPRTAVREFLESNSSFEVDQSIEHKLLITVAPGGFLRRTRA